MVELKVQCDCGQKYKFDVEPVNGRMPFIVNCPVCGVDGTEKANALIEQLPEFQIAQPAPASPEQAKLRLSRSAQEPAVSSAPQPVSPMSVATSSAPPPISAMERPASSSSQAVSDRKPSFAMGLVGGLAGALIGALVYFLIFKYTGLRIKLLAIGVGVLAGWGAELLGKGEGSKELGGITAIFVIAGIIVAQYFVALGWWHDSLAADLDESPYAVSVRQAKQAVAAVPTGSDDEIRNYLAKQGVDGESVDPKLVSDSDIRQFRENQFPQMQKLASGQMSKAEFDAANGINAAQEQKERASEENTFKGVFLLLLLSKTNIVSLVVAAGAAFKLSANA